MQERVCAVVVTWNRQALLSGCLEALARQSHPLAALVVVDNASTDGTDAWVRARHPEAVLLRLPENVGGAGGFATGIARAVEGGADWIWVMDDDAEPAPDALERLFASGLHRRPDTVALASRKVGADGREQRHHCGSYSVVLQHHLPRRRPVGEGLYRIGTSSFVGLLLRTESVRQVGLPRSDFFIFHDDAEYCVRLRRSGALYLVAESVIVHHDGKVRRKAGTTEPTARAWWARRREERLRVRPWRLYYLFRNRLLILNAHAPGRLARVAGWGVSGYRLVRSALAVLLFDRPRGPRLRMLGRAFVDGWWGRSGKRVEPGPGA